MPRSTTGLSYFTLGLTVLGSLIFSVFVIFPQWKNYQNENGVYLSAVKREQSRQSFLDVLEERRMELERYADEAKMLGIVLPDTFIQSNLWVSFDRTASKAGVVISNIGASVKEKTVVKNPSSMITKSATAADLKKDLESQDSNVVAVEEVKDELETWATPIKVTGTYSQIRAFIGGLEEAMIISDVDSLKFDRENTSTPNVNSSLLTASLTVKTYVQPSSLILNK